MSREIKLTITEPTIQAIDDDVGYYVKFTLSDAVDMPNELFVHRVNKPMLGDAVFEFSHIANPLDIEEYPTVTPEVTISDFFRTTEAEFLFKTIDLLTDARVQMQSKISEIIKKLNLLDSTPVVTTIEISF